MQTEPIQPVIHLDGKFAVEVTSQGFVFKFDPRDKSLAWGRLEPLIWLWVRTNYAWMKFDYFRNLFTRWAMMRTLPEFPAAKELN